MVLPVFDTGRSALIGLTTPSRRYILPVMKFSRITPADIVIFLGLVVNAIIIILILYFFVF